MASSTSAVQRVRSFLDAVTRGDLAAIAAHWCDDFVLEMPYATPPLRLEGKEAVRSYLGQALGLFSLHMTMTDVYECPAQGVVIAEYESEGQVTSTGKPYANRYVGIFHLEGEKIRHQREYYNPVPAAEALSEAQD